MFFAIVLLILSAFFFASFGVAVEESDSNRESSGSTVGALFSITIATILGVGGSWLLYYSCTGNIDKPSRRPTAPIYSMCGLAETSQGTVAILEDGEQGVSAVWTKNNLPKETKFVRIAKGDDGEWQLIPVDKP